MTEHICSCAKCDPVLDAVLPAAPEHFGIQFPGQAASLKVFARADCTPYLQEEHEYVQIDISPTVWQVIVGRKGLAWRYSEPTHVCKFCGLRGGVCAYLDDGDFTVAGALNDA